MSRTHLSIKCLLSSILMLHSLTALAQSESDGGDLGSDPGLPAEAPPPPAPFPAAAPTTPATPGSTLPAPTPAPEAVVQPYDSTTPGAPLTRPAPAPKRPVITGKLGELNLSAEQAQQIVNIRRQWKPAEEKRLREDFSFLKQNLAQAMADNSPAEEVRRRFELMQKKYLELQTMKFEKLLRIREVLTPEQRKKFSERRPRPARNNNNNNDND
ncbi:Spy/CpxP family protein refolding chaperone [Oligoflexus tunisiensis]|uniref:Spy/CpxP family protein refolding chaperone n=1 Tax=Oligoflexus tunisiensis TaxID=708132 RepID=UPI00114C9C12|nr:Spy/CpxP family protein refolding chaperone [Oligoflexus tunisiensis]